MSAFGVPITNETLKQMSRYKGKTIGQEDRAREAMRLIQAESKNMKALNHAIELKADFGIGVTALCLVYNATGDRIELVPSQSTDWLGAIYKEEPSKSIENGQWISFLHVHPTGQAVGSEGARVYRATIDGDVRDYLISWCSPYGPTSTLAYTKVGPKDGAQPDRSALENAYKITIDDTDERCKSTVTIGGDTSPQFIAVLQRKFSPLLY